MKGGIRHAYATGAEKTHTVTLNQTTFSWEVLRCEVDDNGAKMAEAGHAQKSIQDRS